MVESLSRSSTDSTLYLVIFRIIFTFRSLQKVALKQTVFSTKLWRPVFDENFKMVPLSDTIPKLLITLRTLNRVETNYISSMLLSADLIFPFFSSNR